MARPLADYLLHFEPAGGARPRLEALTGTPFEEPPEESIKEDAAAAIEAARDEGFADGFAAARDEFEAKLKEEKLTCESQLAAERLRWAQQEWEAGEKITAAFSDIELNIARSVARVLEPFITDALRAKMVDLLADSIGVLLGGKERPVIEISGPQDLLAALQRKLPELSGKALYVSNDAIDVRVVAGETMIETQIGAWVERVRPLWGMNDGGN
jgi:flagellar biosynthesis/type III secretory pathway protein FliH